jgi:hypothetical protein
MSQPLTPAPERTLRVAGMLIDTDCLTTPEDVRYYFEKPHKYQHLADLWQEAGEPEPGSDGWALFAARMERLDD